MKFKVVAPPNGLSSLSAPKRPHCAEVLLLPKTYAFPDGSIIITFGTKRFR